MSHEETAKERTLDQLCDAFLAEMKYAEDAGERVMTISERLADLWHYWKRMRAIQRAMRRLTEG